MSIVSPYIEVLESKAKDLDKIARQAVVDNMDFILHLIKEEQLGKGKNAMDIVVGRYASITKKYAEADRAASGGLYPRKEKNTGEPYNFDWFGGFKDGIYLKMETEGFDIMSRDGKVDLLERTYGKLLKLTQKHNKIVNEQIVLPALYKFILSF